MATTDEATKRCPRCEAPLDHAAYYSGQPFHCANCGARVQRRPGLDDPPIATAVPVATSESFLADVEDVLIKMILGVFRFILVKVPQEIYWAVLRWFPTVVRLTRVVLLLAAWLALVAGPLVIRYFPAQRGPAWWPDLNAWEVYARHAAAYDGLILLYSILAVCGSAWGVLYIRRRRRQARVERTRS